MTSEDMLHDRLNRPITNSQLHSPVSEGSTPREPLSNRTISLIMDWFNNGNSTKSAGELNRLVHNAILQPNFDKNELKNFNAQRELRKIDSMDETLMLMARASPLAVILNRRLISVIRAAFVDPLASKYHLSPFKLFHKSSTTAPEQRVYSELYNSDAFIDEHDKVQRAPLPTDDPDCKLEKVVAALMFWSDSTHLANFGTAKMWPIYMLLGNLSKYVRCQPSSGACHHVAYIPSLPDSFQDAVADFHTKWGTQKKSILAHCRRELMHAIWKVLLDDEFIHAYHYGIVITCWDGIKRRVYPRIFTYSADYPEKVLLATIRDKGSCPCPRCMIPKTRIDLMGQVRDLAFRGNMARKFMFSAVERARKLIYTSGLPIGGAAVERELFSTSSVPTMNAFVDKLGINFPLSRMLAVDLLHEFELGVWKALFIHVIRLLYAASPRGDLVAEFDRRIRHIPTFGTTIRRFATNASEMKKLAARDFEDLLQCCIPAFEGLLPSSHNKRLMKLLYRTAEWHAFAKLRMHTSATLSHLEALTTEFGRLMREFRDLTCAEFDTVELPSEASARVRRENRNSPNSPATPAPPGHPDGARPVRKAKTLNLFTYKWHALGDYAQAIRLFGGTDSFSTQLGELSHRLVKRLYGLTNKRDATKQIGKRYRRLQKARVAWSQRLQLHADEEEASRRSNPQLHHHITQSKNHPIDLLQFVKQNAGDPAINNFVPKLQEHLLGRLLGRDFDGDTHETFTPDDRNTVRIVGNRIYSGQVCRVYYTTYDIRRTYDSINPRTHADIMVASPEGGEDAHPYWYGRTIGIYHADVFTTHPNAPKPTVQRMEFLWVRWFGVEPRYRAGFRHARLPKIGFVADTDEYAFGFLDPSLVIRGCHLIPAFHTGRTTELLQAQSVSFARRTGDLDDWVNFYVGIFLDRDMTMRFYGGGVGHIHQHLGHPSPTEPLEAPTSPEEEYHRPHRVENDDDDDDTSSGGEEGDEDLEEDEDVQSDDGNSHLDDEEHVDEDGYGMDDDLDDDACESDGYASL
ncbi:hypothetical protein BD779DRAFT_1613865 [Infundibulicybe gibba]|nr:hypothetical protein BD779DRAFT_1613865 [Infundibulicybe gibba]